MEGGVRHRSSKQRAGQRGDRDQDNPATSHRSIYGTGLRQVQIGLNLLDPSPVDGDMRSIFSRNGARPTSVAILVAAALVAVPIAGSGAAAAGGSPHREQRRAATVRVNVHDFAFHPHKLTVAPGTRVTFANRDPIAHTATSAGNFATGHIRPGHSVTVKLKKAGVYAYHCSIHHFMHGKIVVG
jgi:plastocyanin